MFHLRLLCIMALSGVALTVGVSTSSAAEPTDLSKDPWPGLVQDIFNNRPMSDGSNVISIEMPYRAEDAAIVPVTLRSKLAPDDSRRLKAITLVIDQNPAPMAAKFEIGPTHGFRKYRRAFASIAIPTFMPWLNSVTARFTWSRPM